MNCSVSSRWGASWVTSPQTRQDSRCRRYIKFRQAWPKNIYPVLILAPRAFRCFLYFLFLNHFKGEISGSSYVSVRRRKTSSKVFVYPNRLTPCKKDSSPLRIYTPSTRVYHGRLHRSVGLSETTGDDRGTGLGTCHWVRVYEGERGNVDRWVVGEVDKRKWRSGLELVCV